MADFEQKGLSWLEPACAFVNSLNQAAKLLEENNYHDMTTFLKKIGSNHRLQYRRLIFTWGEPYDLIAVAPKNLTFTSECRRRESNSHDLAVAGF